MIIVVEGPSAAGKTTWAARFAPELVVSESRPMHPPPSESAAAARYWADLGSDRWVEAERIERQHGIAVCDTDPLKLHYAWSLWRIGELDEADLRRQIVAYREAVAEGRLGFADRYYVEIPAADVLAERKARDASRGRRNFALHVRLGDPMQEWYGAIEELRPGSVVWSYPARLPGRLPRQTDQWPGDIVTFDRLTERLIGGP
jgi:hypothetical protein